MKPLEYLLGAYFHEDYVEMTSDSQATVAAFIEENPHRLVETLAELNDLLAHHDEAMLAQYAAEAYSAYLPPASDGGHTRWFSEIAEQLRRALAQSGVS